MALTEETIQDKIEIVGTWNIQVRTAVVIKRDGTEISRSFSRHILVPFNSSKDEDDKWTHTATDISAEDASVQAIANAAWNDTVKAAYKTWAEAQEV